MSRQTVGVTIDRLLSDEEFREGFLSYPFDTVAALHLEGVELTPDEIRALVQADVSTWLCGESFDASVIKTRWRCTRD